MKNEAKSGLGLAMPAGTVRVYQADSKGGTQFAGEDRIRHTPKDETINLKIGNAFDVTCERKQTDFERIASNVYELEYEITLRNHKAIPVSIEVNEPIGGTWRMLRQLRVEQDVGLGCAVQSAGGGRWTSGCEVSGRALTEAGKRGDEVGQIDAWPNRSSRPSSGLPSMRSGAPTTWGRARSTSRRICWSA